jgi:hypothetical protein
MRIRSVGIDLGKTTFHLVALGDNGNFATPNRKLPKTGLSRNTSSRHPFVPSMVT